LIVTTNQWKLYTLMVLNNIKDFLG